MQLLLAELSVANISKVNIEVEKFNWKNGKIAKLLQPNLKVKGNSSQLLEFFLCFPEIIKGKTMLFPTGRWDLYLTLRDIISIVYSPVIARPWLNELKNLTASLNKKVRKIFPQARITPTMH